MSELKFGEKLIQAGIIDQAQLGAALSHQSATGQRIGEALLELGYISEDNLLKFLAKEFSTRFVSTKKLSRINLPQETLEIVPQPMAEEHLVFPVLLNRDKSTLGIVTCEPQNLEVQDELKIITALHNIQVYVATREAIIASIKKHYKGDIHAFSSLDQEGREQFDQMMDMYADRVLTETDEGIQLEPRVEPRSSGPVVMEPDPRDPTDFASEGTSSWTKAIEAVRGNSLVSDNDFIETLNILVGLLEMQRTNLQGHSAQVAKWTKAISERLGLSERDINHNIIAAYLHDLGKRSSAHLTLLSIANSEDHRKRARRYHLTPARLFDSVHLPPQVNHVIGHLYESFDGTGLPEQLSGEGIPTGARIIAVVDAYEDLVKNPTNPMGRTLDPEEAMAALTEKTERLFDPQIVRMLSEVAQGEAALAKLGATSPLVLLADKDNASTSVIELKLVKKGFRVRVARDSQTARESLRSEPVSAVLLEMRLTPDDGFSIVDFIKAQGLDLPIFLTSGDTSPEAITRAFDAGVVDFISKPYVPDVVIAKIQKELTRQPSQPPAGALTMPPPADEEEEIGVGVVIELDSMMADAMADASGAIGLEDEPTPTGGPVLDLSDAEEQPGVPLDPAETVLPALSLQPKEGSMPGPPSGTMAGVVTTNSGMLTGTLEGRKAIALIRALSGKRKSGQLSLRNGDTKGFIYFEGGHIFQAMLGEAEAEEAFLELAAWEDCLYKFDPTKTPRKRVIMTGTGKLIQIASME